MTRDLPIWMGKRPDNVPRHDAAALARTLVEQMLAHFAKNQSLHLELIRTHLLDLLDSKPALGRGQNLRSAHALLGRYPGQFNRAFHAALVKGLGEELALLMPKPAAPSKPNQRAEDPLDGMSLSLIDIDEVERILLVDRVAQRFSLHYDAALESLTQRLGNLLGRDSTSAADNPFRPVVLVRAFAQAWDSCELDPQATEDLVLSLEPSHGLDLAPMYEALNATLAQAGVAAQRLVRIKRSAESASDPHGVGHAPLEPPQPADAPTGSTWSPLAPLGRTMADQARQFLRRMGLIATHSPEAGTGSYQPASAYADQSAPPGHHAADPALMGYLGVLQADARSKSGQPEFHDVDAGHPNVLREMRERHEIRGAPELDRGTVDALAEVFEFVFADQSIPPEMKVLIGRLQIPVLKAAMIDRDFFLSDQHPARRLVDTLSGASVAWAPDKGENDPLYLRVEHTVQRILTEFEDDLTLFVDLLREFTEFLFESEQQAQARVEPVAQHARTDELMDQARSEVDELINERLQTLPRDQPLLPFLLPFLTSPWRDVMALALLNDIENPLGYEHTLSTMEQLIWSTRPKTHSEDRRKLVGILPELVRQLNTGLDAIAWNGTPRAEFTRRLIATHTMAIRMTQAPGASAHDTEQDLRAGKAAVQQLDERRAARLPAFEDEFDEKSHALVRGLWFDFLAEGHTHVRCRLSWVSPMRTRLLFTNRDGFDAFVRSEREVASMLRLGRLVALEHAPIVARALDKLLQEPLALQAA